MNTINTSYYTPSFRSTLVPYKKVELNKVLKILESSFELKTFKNAQECKKFITYADAGIMYTKEGLLFAGKDKAADEFIHSQLKKVVPEAKYIEDDIAISNHKEEGFSLLIY